MFNICFFDIYYIVHVPCNLIQEYILKKSIAVLIRSLTEENTEEDEDEVVSKVKL